LRTKSGQKADKKRTKSGQKAPNRGAREEKILEENSRRSICFDADDLEISQWIFGQIRDLNPNRRSIELNLDRVERDSCEVLSRANAWQLRFGFLASPHMLQSFWLSILGKALFTWPLDQQKDIQERDSASLNDANHWPKSRIV